MKRALIFILAFIILLTLTACAHEHEFGEWETVKEATCTEDGLKERACSCGEKESETLVTTGHEFGEWEIVEDPSCVADGIKERFCSCGEKETETIPMLERTVLEIGETAETDIVEFTLDTIRFADKVSLDYGEWLKPVNGSGGLSAGDGNVFVWFSFTAKNLSKEDLSGYDVCTAEIDYNNGYTYGDGIYTDLAGWSTDSMISKNVGLTSMKPLGEAEYYGFIRCVSDVKTDRESPLLLIVTLPSTSGEKQFAYNYAVPEGSDTGKEALAISEAFNNAIDELTFVEKYAGNTNKSGSRKFADSKIESIQGALANIDIDYINENFPMTAERLPEIQSNIEQICDMLIDMGKTNSGKDVDTMKSMSRDTISIIEELLSTEFSAFI